MHWSGTHILGPVGTNKMCFLIESGNFFHPFNIYLHLVYTPKCSPKTFHVIDACSLVYCKTFINFRVAEQSVHCTNTFTSKMLSLLCAVSRWEKCYKRLSPKRLNLGGEVWKEDLWESLLVQPYIVKLSPIQLKRFYQRLFECCDIRGLLQNIFHKLSEEGEEQRY